MAASTTWQEQRGHGMASPQCEWHPRRALTPGMAPGYGYGARKCGITPRHKVVFRAVATRTRSTACYGLVHGASRTLGRYCRNLACEAWHFHE